MVFLTILPGAFADTSCHSDADFLAGVNSAGVNSAGVNRKPAAASILSRTARGANPSSPISAGSGAGSLSQTSFTPAALGAERIIDTVVVLPSDFSAGGAHEEALKDEARSVVAAANRYLGELSLRIRIREFQIFHAESEDPYAPAVAAQSAQAMLQTAADRWQSYDADDYDLVLVLARGQFAGQFGLAWPATSCISRKYSVVFATQAGETSLRSYAFGHTVAHEVGHFLGMSHDGESYPDGPSVMWARFTPKPFGFSERSILQAEAHSGIGRAGGACLESLETFATDSDRDGVDDAAEQLDGTDPYDPGSARVRLKSPVYAPWNSFLRTINILELVNPADDDRLVTVQLFALDGTLVHEQTLPVPALQQFDLIVNDLPGFVADSYGLLKISFDGELDGRMSYYRLGQDGYTHEFAFSVPLLNGVRGASGVAFNTFQPSKAAAEHLNEVANWLTLINLSGVRQVYRVTTFDSLGAISLVRTVAVGPRARIDIDGGHGFAGQSAAGFHEILPVDDSAPYLAQLIRYGSSSTLSAASAYSFAFPLTARAGNGRTQYVPVSTASGEDTWVEMTNTLLRRLPLQLTVQGASGAPLLDIPLELGSHQQLHFNVASVLREHGESDGFVRLAPARRNALIAQSMSYYAASATGSIETVSGAYAEEPWTGRSSGSYNLYLGMENYLKVLNPSAVQASISVRITRPTVNHEVSFELAPGATLVLPLHDTERFKTEVDSYGLVSLEAAGGVPLSAQLLRLRRVNGGVDLVLPTAMR